MLLQYRSVFIYFDDYGYLSLSYGFPITDVTGHSYGWQQLLRFLYHHYYEANGRLLYLSIYLALFKMGGLTAVRVFMAAAVTAGLMLAEKAVFRCSGCRDRFFSALFLCAAFGILNIELQRQSSYWFAASFFYILPAVSFWLFAGIYGRTLGEKQLKKNSWILCLLTGFLIGFSHEQWAVAALVFSAGVLCCRLYDTKKLCPWDLAVLTAVFMGFLPILLSPGARSRMEERTMFLNVPFLQRSALNAQYISSLFFSKENFNYAVFLLLFLLYAALMRLQERNGRFRRMLHIVFAVADLMMLISLVGRVKIPTGFLIRHHSGTADFCFIILMFAEVMNICIYEKRRFAALLLISALASVGCLVLVPDIAERTLMQCNLISAGMLCALQNDEGAGEKFLRIRRLLILLASAAALCNMLVIYQGYRVNARINAANDAAMEAASLRAAEGEKHPAVVFQKYPDLLYGNVMPYMEGFAFMQGWMLEYYDLPQDTEIIYRDPHQ